jgi:hypothetical protein
MRLREEGLRKIREVSRRRWNAAVERRVLSGRTTSRRYLPVLQAMTAA